MNPRSWFRLGPVFLVAVSMVIVDTGVAKAQGAEIGRYEYLNSCASCHGTTGKGDGPVVKSLIKPPTDLTRLSETNSGVFPFARIYDVIDGRFELATHGTRDMPVWGEIYKRSWAQGQNGTLPYLASKEVVESIVRMRILALIDYIFMLQEGRR
jgi:mono/diheme cytochrome c family protein